MGDLAEIFLEKARTYRVLARDAVLVGQFVQAEKMMGAAEAYADCAKIVQPEIKS